MLYRQIQTRAKGESLYVRYNTDANVVNGLKNSSSYEPTVEKSLEIDEVYAELDSKELKSKLKFM